MKETSENIKIIETKLFKLKRLDKSFSVFGSENHRYEFSSKVSEEEVLQFEKEHKIILPHSYREFILHFGNAGCGPCYGLLKFKYGVLDNPSSPKASGIIKLSNELRFNTFWNLEEYLNDDYQKWEDEYDDAKWCDGMLRICNEGCGYFVNLVITGKDRGHVWIDARVSEGGIYPVNYHKGKEKTSFIEWYLDWLNNAIEKLTNK